MKKLLEKFRRFWWSEFTNRLDIFNVFERASYRQYHRNDADFEEKRRFENTVFLDRFGYKVYSQNDEDGIIEEIFNRIGLTNKKFVEFGVQNGLECNSHFLLHKGWSGLWIEGSKEYVDEAGGLFSTVLENGRLAILNAFITAANINQLIGEAGNITGEIDLLSIDIDGNDYWVWEAINRINPRVVVIEYNAKFPPGHEWIMKYDEHHVWNGDDEQGASLKSLELLGERLGFQLVGTNYNGVNAFFVKKELAKNLFPMPASAENLYNPARWRVRYISGHPSRKYIGN
jgi:hypothetical protein